MRRLTYRPLIERNIAKCLEEGRPSGEVGSVPGEHLFRPETLWGSGAWGNHQFVRSRAKVWQGGGAGQSGCKASGV